MKEGKRDMVQATTADAEAECDHPVAGRVWHATYVLYENVLDYLACGWMVAIPNGAGRLNWYGIVMEWRCDCKIVRPKR